MTFGIGVITTGDRQLSETYGTLTDRESIVHVVFDVSRRGPGWARNQAIHTLYDAKCEYIALFDDDCYPIRPDWQTYVVDGMTRHGIHALTLRNHKNSMVIDKRYDRLISDSRGPGVVTVGSFICLTRHAVETIGYFDSRFEGYGYEDAHYLYRIRRSKINETTRGDVSLLALHEYINACDVTGAGDFDRHAALSSQEKSAGIARNWPIYAQAIADPRNYYPYTQ